MSSSSDEKPVLLLESEAAERLRCSTSRIKRLRLSGQLAYLPGRPLFILESDLLDFIQRIRVDAKTAPEPTKSGLTQLELETIQKRARMAFLKRKLGMKKG